MPARFASARLVLAASLLTAGLIGCGGDDGLASGTGPTGGGAATVPGADSTTSSTSTTTNLTATTAGSGSASTSPAVSTSAPPDDTTTTRDLPGPGRMLFRCATTNGKQIELTEYGTIIRYVFGPVGEPEIVLDVDRSLATTYQWQGVGRNERYSVDVPNPTATDHAYVYSVFWDYDKVTEGPEALSAGVVVNVDGDPAATVECADPESAVMKLIGVDLAPTA